MQIRNTYHSDEIVVRTETRAELVQNYYWYVQAWGKSKKFDSHDYEIITLPKSFKVLVKAYMKEREQKP